MSPQDETEDLTMLPNEKDAENQNVDEKPSAADDGSLTTASKNEEPAKDPDPLTRQQVWNLAFCLLAWGFTVANVTLGK